MFQESTTQALPIMTERELMDYCNKKDSLNCDLQKCVYSLVDRKCNAINDNLYTDSEQVNEFYKESIVEKGLKGCILCAA